MKYPHRLYEIDEAGKAIHRSPYDGKLHDGVLYADNGFWDTFRCVYAFYSVALSGAVERDPARMGASLPRERLVSPMAQPG